MHLSPWYVYAMRSNVQLATSTLRRHLRRYLVKAIDAIAICARDLEQRLHYLRRSVEMLNCPCSSRGSVAKQKYWTFI